MIDKTIMDILLNLITFGSFVLLYYVLNLGEQELATSSHKRGAKVIYWLVFTGYLSLLFAGLFLHLFVWMLGNGGTSPIITAPEMTATELHPFALSLWVPALLAVLFFIPLIRQKIALVISIRPDSRIHTLSLVISTLIIMQMAMTYAIGMETLSSAESNKSAWNLIFTVWSQDIMFALLGFVGVGFLTRRSFSEALKRLGLTKPTMKHVVLGISIALGLVVLITLVENLLIYTHIEQNENVQEYTEKLIGPLLTSIPGILTLGLAAAIGEETIFRGALQPRFGILLTSLLFALVHSNYGLSISTLIVFGLGICLGFVRVRFNTTTAMIVHAAYNICIGILSYIQS